MDEVEHCGHSLFPELQQWHNFNLNKGREKVGKIAPFYYGLENGRSGKWRSGMLQSGKRRGANLVPLFSKNGCYLLRQYFFFKFEDTVIQGGL